jgi:hypothetical protein
MINQETCMNRNTLIAAATVAALASPLAAFGQAGGPAGASAVGTGPTGGKPSTDSAGRPMDFTGDPVGAFRDLDRDRSGSISRTEWDDYYRSRPAAGSAATGGTSGIRDNPATVDRTPASSPTGVTAGPGTASERTGPGSATATQPSTSGHGTPK